MLHLRTVCWLVIVSSLSFVIMMGLCRPHQVLTAACTTPADLRTLIEQAAALFRSIDLSKAGLSLVKNFDPYMFIQMLVCFAFASSTLRGSKARR